MSWVFLPSDPQAQAAGRDGRGGAPPRAHARGARASSARSRSERQAERGEREDAGFHALSSTGRADDFVMTSQPGDQLGLFGGPAAARPRRRAGARGRSSAPSRPVEETSYEKRERLREERAALVKALRAARASPTARSTRASTRRRASTSVAKATVAQLEKGNRKLEKQLPSE